MAHAAFRVEVVDLGATMNRITVRIAAMILAITTTFAEVAGIALLASYEVQTVADGGDARVVVATTARNFTCDNIERATCCQPCTHVNAHREHGSATAPRR